MIVAAIPAMAVAAEPEAATRVALLVAINARMPAVMTGAAPHPPVAVPAAPIVAPNAADAISTAGLPGRLKNASTFRSISISCPTAIALVPWSASCTPCAAPSR